MATPVEHYETAERYLEQADQAADPLHAQRLAMRASVHATLAGVPWSRDDVDELAAGLTRDEVAALLDVVRELASWSRLHVATLAPGVPDDEQEPYLAGWNAARERVRDLVEAAELVEVLDR